MASIINADDGVISGAAGIKLSADTSGDLNIQTNGVTAISVSASQVVSFPATTGFSIASATVTNLVATSLTVSSGSTLNGGVVINELGADADTRIEGDTDANLFFVDASADNVGIGTSSPVGKLTIAYPAGANAPTTVTAANTYLQLGSAEFGASNNGKFMIGFGYTDALVNTNSPAYIGYEEVSTSGDTFGNLTFYTRSVTTDTAPDKRMTIDSSGNLGLGVTPSAWDSNRKAFQIGGNGALWGQSSGSGFLFLSNNLYYDGTDFRYLNTAASGNYVIGSDASFRWNQAASGTAGDPITFTQAMTLTAGGLLQVSGGSTNTTYTSSGEIALKNSGSSPNISWHSDTGTRIGYLQMQSSGIATLSVGVNQPLVFETNATERCRVTATGDLLVGTTSDSVSSGDGCKIIGSGVTTGPNVVTAYTTDAQVCYRAYSTGAGAHRFYVGWGGNIYATSASIIAISDQRLKENIRDLDVGLDAVMALKPRKFDWKEGKGADIKDARGFIAQEFEEVFPDLVKEWLDPTPEGEEPYKSVRQDLIPVLVKAIQELSAKNDALEARLAALEAK